MDANRPVAIAITSLVFAALLFAATANATPITFQVNVDTSSVSGTAGSLDFQFNPGPLAPVQAAFLDVASFSSDGTLTPPASPIGDVSGTLPATITFDNGTGFNDYFEGFTFGSNLSFDVTIYGSGLGPPNKPGKSGSTFAFSMFSDAGGTTPALTTDTTDGFAVIIDVNVNGGTTVTDLSTETTVNLPAAPAPSQVPEPTTVLLVGVGLGAMWRRRRRIEQ